MQKIRCTYWRRVLVALGEARRSQSYREANLVGVNSMKALLAHEFIDIAQLINLNNST